MKYITSMVIEYDYLFEPHVDASKLLVFLCMSS